MYKNERMDNCRCFIGLDEELEFRSLNNEPGTAFPKQFVICNTLHDFFTELFAQVFRQFRQNGKASQFHSQKTGSNNGWQRG